MVKAFTFPRPGIHSSRLHLGVGDQVRVQGALQRGDLGLEQRQLGTVAAGLERVARLQLGHAREVELLQQAIDAVLGTHAFLDQPQPRAHQVTRAALGGHDHVGYRDQVGSEQKRQGVRVHLDQALAAAGA